jgi:hypothetical protein
MIKPAIISSVSLIVPTLAYAHDLPGLFQQYIELDATERAALDIARDARSSASTQLKFVPEHSNGLEAVIRKHSVGVWTTGTTISACFFPAVPANTSG